MSAHPQAIVVLHRDSDRQKVKSWVERLPWGTRIEFKKPRRTLPQNALMCVLLTEISEQVVWYGAKLTPEDWKDVLSASLRKARVVPGLDAGSFVPLGMRTSDMSVEEMTLLIELIFAFGAEQGVTFQERSAA